MDTPEIVDITKQNWDYLIIFDACRYDYFADLYEYYLKGKLHKVYSSGTCTNEWLIASFPEIYDDIIYITANPHVSDTLKVHGYCAGDHFHRVHELWKTAWDDKIGTISPKTVTDNTIAILKQINAQDKRVIIHYIQPHAPYLNIGIDPDYVGGIVRPDESRKISRKPSTIKKYLYHLCHAFFKNTSLIGNHPDWMLRKFFKLPPETPMEYVLHEYDVETLRSSYKENLKAVLSETARLLNFLSGKVVVTSDHGEFLGENKNFSHPCSSNHPILREIPWLEILKEKKMNTPDEENKSEDRCETQEGSLDEIVIERLKALGYHE